MARPSVGTVTMINTIISIGFDIGAYVVLWYVAELISEVRRIWDLPEPEPDAAAIKATIDIHSSSDAVDSIRAACKYRTEDDAYWSIDPRREG